MLAILDAHRGPLAGAERDFVLQGLLQGCFPGRYRADAAVRVGLSAVDVKADLRRLISCGRWQPRWWTEVVYQR